MEISAINDGKVYAIHVKICPNVDWDAPDVIYAIAHEGNGGLSYTGFKNLCNKDNNKCFLAKKANVKSDRSCTWAEIRVTLDAWPMMGNPGLILVEHPETFY